jgi:hypothetical protein
MLSSSGRGLRCSEKGGRKRELGHQGGVLL